MPTQAEIAEQKRALGDVSTVALYDLRGLWRDLDTTDVDALRASLIAALPVLVADHYATASTVAADWYDLQRLDAQVPGRFTATVPEPPEKGRTDALARWSIGPYFRDQPDPGDDRTHYKRGDLTTEAAAAASLSLLSGGFQRLVQSGARETTALAVDRDPAGATYARVASPGACAFCRLLATRGADFGSRESALRVVGRGTAAFPRPIIKPRGSRALGEKYHDHCDCTAEPSWPSAPYVEPDYVAEWREQYKGSVQTSGKYDTVDLKATLATWRDTYGVS